MPRATDDVKTKFHVSFVNPDGSEDHFVPEPQEAVVHWPHREQAMNDVNDALKSPERNGRPVAMVKGNFYRDAITKEFVLGETDFEELFDE